MGQERKVAMIVDDDIDARSWEDVIWAISTRTDPSRDITLVGWGNTVRHCEDVAEALEPIGVDTVRTK